MEKPRLRKVELAPLRLVQSWVEELHIGPPRNPALDEGLEVKLSRPQILQNPEDIAEYLVRLRIRVQEPDRVTEMVVAGRFRLEGDESASASKRMVDYNAPAILFGIARGMVGTVTALTSLGRLELPSVNIAQLVDG